MYVDVVDIYCVYKVVVDIRGYMCVFEKGRRD